MNTIGVLGGRWRATVSPAGCIQPWGVGDETPLDWFIAADDRWHVPAQEAAVRQRRIDGAPVFETRLRVPSGDAVHRVWCVADDGGFTVIEIENDSTLPFAVAFSRGDVLSLRAPTNVPIEGIDLPSGSVVFPVGHHSTIRVAVAHSPGISQLPDGLASAMQVARGWTSVIDRSGRILVPDDSVIADIARLRGELALNGPIEPSDDPTAFLIDVAQLVRMGERAAPWVPDVADAVGAVARLDHAWDVVAALDGAAVVLCRAGETRAVHDVGRMRQSSPTDLPTQLPAGCDASRTLCWHEQRVARASGAGTADLMSGGIPAAWLGGNFEVHGLPLGPASTVAFAVRWHGDRPAVLWQVDGAPVRLSATSVAPEWFSTEARGEALWPAPIVAATTNAPVSGTVIHSDISFD
jgi:hypothetical protein